VLYEETHDQILKIWSGIWTSISGEPYISYTANYIRIPNKVFTNPFFPDHTAENIAEALQDTLQ